MDEGDGLVLPPLAMHSDSQYIQPGCEQFTSAGMLLAALRLAAADPFRRRLLPSPTQRNRSGNQAECVDSKLFPSSIVKVTSSSKKFHQAFDGSMKELSDNFCIVNLLK